MLNERFNVASGFVASTLVSIVTVGGIIGTFGAFYVSAVLADHKSVPHTNTATKEDIMIVSHQISTAQLAVKARIEMSELVQASNIKEHGRIMKQQNKMLSILEELQARSYND